jgi:hypothetical protein
MQKIGAGGFGLQGGSAHGKGYSTGLASTVASETGFPKHTLTEYKIPYYAPQLLAHGLAV